MPKNLMSFICVTLSTLIVCKVSLFLFGIQFVIAGFGDGYGGGWTLLHYSKSGYSVFPSPLYSV